MNYRENGATKSMTSFDTIKKELKEWYIALFKAKRPSEIHREIFKEFEKEYIGMTEKSCDNCYWCMGRSEYDAICEKTRLIHPKMYSCVEWKKNE